MILKNLIEVEGRGGMSFRTQEERRGMHMHVKRHDLIKSKHRRKEGKKDFNSY